MSYFYANIEFLPRKFKIVYFLLFGLRLEGLYGDNLLESIEVDQNECIFKLCHIGFSGADFMDKKPVEG